MKRNLVILFGIFVFSLSSTELVSAQSKTIKLINEKTVSVKGSIFGGAVYSDAVCEEKQYWSGKLPEGDADNEYAIAMISNYKLAGYTIEILLK